MSNITLKIRHLKRQNGTKIDLNNLDLQSFPTELYQLSNLTSIDLSNNQINEIEKKIESFLSLEELNLENNNISSLPSEILNLNKLKKLKLKNNPIYLKLKNFEIDWRTSLHNFINDIDELVISSEQDLNDYDNKIMDNKLRDNDEIKHLKFTISQLQAEVKSLKLKSDNNIVQEIKKEDLFNTKRNWMENSNNIIHNSSDRATELESQLQKEILNNKRMKNEIERLSQQISSKNNFGDDFIKNILQINYDEIELNEKIGQGGFSLIYKGVWNFLTIAVKIIFDPNVTEDLLNEFNNEIKMLFLLRHPNIMLMIGISTNQKLAIITEYVENGSLFEYLHKTNKELKHENKVRIIKQIISTLAFIHSNGIVHRDLKSHNVLLDSNMNIKLCDFGLAKYRNELSLGSGKFSGTPAYMAPELFMKRNYDEKIDVFAFGTLVWEILVRKIPYESYDLGEIKNKILSDEKIVVPKNFSIDWNDFINKCRINDPGKRPSFNELAKINIESFK